MKMYTRLSFIVFVLLLSQYALATVESMFSQKASAQANPNIKPAALLPWVGFKPPSVDSQSLLTPTDPTYLILAYDEKMNRWLFHKAGDTVWHNVNAVDTTKITQAFADNRYMKWSDSVNSGPIMTEAKAMMALSDIDARIDDSVSVLRSGMTVFVKYPDTSLMLFPYSTKGNLKDTAAVLRSLVLSSSSASVKYTDTSSMLAPYTMKSKVLSDSAVLSAGINQRVKYTDTAAMLAPYSTKSNLKDTATVLRGIISTGLAGKQNVLISGTNIKTIGGIPLLGSGDVSVSTGTVTSIGLSSTDFDITGSPVTTGGTITANLKSSGVTSGVYNTVAVNSKGIVTSGNASSSTVVTRSFNTNYRLSTSQSSRVSYSFTHTISLTLVLTSGSTSVFLETSPDNGAGVPTGTWTVISKAGYSDAVAVAVSITKTTTNNVQGEIPANTWFRLRTAGTGAGLTSGVPNVTYDCGQETTY